MGYLFLAFVVIVILAAIGQGVGTSNKKKAMEARLKSLPDFTVTQHFMGCDGISGIGVDEDRRKICLIVNQNRFQTEYSRIETFCR